MTATPSSRFFKTNWLNCHHNQCSKLTRNYYETIIIGDSIAARLSRHQNVLTKFLQPLKALNSGIGGDKAQNVLWRGHNLPVVKSVTEVVFLYCTNNLNQDSTEGITDGIIEVASNFKSKYGSKSIFVCGITITIGQYIECILKRSIISKNKMLLNVFTFIFPDSGWTLSNGSLDPDLFYLDIVHLVENGNLKLAESIFSLIQNIDNIKHNNHI